MNDNTRDNVPDFAAPGQGGFVGFIDWLNEKLYPVIGPADLGPYEPVVKKVGDAVCPLCGKPMSQHVIDRTLKDTILYCPAETD